MPASGSCSASSTFVGVDRDHARHALGEVAARDFHLAHFRLRVGVADLDLDALGGRFANQRAVAAAHEVDDRLVEAVAADAHRLRVHDAVERDHRDLGGAAADVDDHRAARLVDRDAGADRGRHRLFDQVDLAGAGLFRRLLDRAALDLGRAAGHADQHARARAQEARGVHLADELLEHLSVWVKSAMTPSFIGRCVVMLPGCGRACAWPRADRGDFAHAVVVAHGDHGRLVQDDALSGDVDEGIGRAQVDRKVVGEKAAQLLDIRGLPGV
jgi:hypothetical protein